MSLIDTSPWIPLGTFSILLIRIVKLSETKDSFNLKHEWYAYSLHMRASGLIRNRRNLVRITCAVHMYLFNMNFGKITLLVINSFTHQSILRSLETISECPDMWCVCPTQTSCIDWMYICVHRLLLHCNHMTARLCLVSMALVHSGKLQIRKTIVKETSNKVMLTIS